MAERVLPIRFPLSTADAEGPASLRFQNGELLLALRDWESKECMVEFTDVVGFRWTLEGAHERLGLRDDEIYEIQDSDWIRGLVEVGSIESADAVRHVLIGFNEEGAWLEVVCGGWRGVQ
jgi:hypothetical protein